LHFTKRRNSILKKILELYVRPVGHVETEPLAWGRTPEETTERLGALSLYDVKTALDEAIARAPAEW
jgi:hypothetical protein